MSAPIESKTQARKAFGRGKFILAEAQEALGVSRVTVTKVIQSLIEQGLVERLDERQKVTDENGEPQRGRPRHVYRVA